MIGEHADALVLFGITGDLAKKKLIPALYELTAEGRLDMPVVGTARSQWTDERLAEHVREVLQGRDKSIVDQLCSHLSYVEGDYQNPAVYDLISEKLGDAQLPVFFMAIPPSLFDDVATGLAGVGFATNGRLVVEKPFGRNLASAIELNEILHRHFHEDQIFRIDHFLGKEPVQNLLVFRFANVLLEPIWNRHHVASVMVTMSEAYGIEGRGRFYDSVGAIRDVIQNHLLQIVGLLAMEPPVSSEPDTLRDEIVKVMKAIPALTPDNVVRGRYDGYLDEPDVSPTSDTETFAAVRLEIDNWRWAGVPFFIRAGKGMDETVTEAVIELRQTPQDLFAPEGKPSRPGCRSHRRLRRCARWRRTRPLRTSHRGCPRRRSSIVRPTGFGRGGVAHRRGRPRLHDAAPRLPTRQFGPRLCFSPAGRPELAETLRWPPQSGSVAPPPPNVPPMTLRRGSQVEPSPRSNAPAGSCGPCRVARRRPCSSNPLPLTTRSTGRLSISIKSTNGSLPPEVVIATTR